MAKIIEICGAPGAGKTTIYEEVVLQWHSKCNWLPARQLFPQVRLQFTDLTTLSKVILKKLQGALDDKVMRAAAERFISENPDYIDAIWNNTFYRKRRGANGADLRFYASAYWYEIVKKTATLRYSGSSKWALLDESLIQRIDSALYRSTTAEEEQEEVLTLLEIMPLPEALIYLEPSVQENINRLRARKKIIPAHKDLSDAELALEVKHYQRRWEPVCQKLHERGIPVLKIDAADKNESVRSILDFLQRICSN